MKSLLCMLLLSLGITTVPGWKVKQYTVSGIVTQSGTYCGGAAPTPKMEYEATVHRPYPGKKLYIKHGNVNTDSVSIIDSVITDEHGRFSLRLPPGEYCMVRAEQLDRDILDRYNDPKGIIRLQDSACLEKWWDTCLQQFTVTDREVDTVNIHFYRRCFLPEAIPCLGYFGPYPP